jgi:hypothetical protein
MGDNFGEMERRLFLKYVGALAIPSVGHGQLVKQLEEALPPGIIAKKAVPKDELAAFVFDWNPVDITEYSVGKIKGVSLNPSQYSLDKSIDTIVSPNGKFWISDGIIDKSGKVHKVMDLASDYVKDKGIGLTALDNIVLYDLAAAKLILMPSGVKPQERGQENIPKIAGVALRVADDGSCLYYLIPSGIAQNLANPMGAVFAYPAGKKLQRVVPWNNYGNDFEFRDFQLSGDGKTGGLTTTKEFFLFNTTDGKVRYKKEGRLKGISENGNVVVFWADNYQVTRNIRQPGYVIRNIKEGKEFPLAMGGGDIKNFVLSEQGNAVLISQLHPSGYWDWRVYLAQSWGFDNSAHIMMDENCRKVVRVDNLGGIHLVDKVIPYQRDPRSPLRVPLERVPRSSLF